MTPVLTICADCERHALAHPGRGRAMTEALIGLTRLLLDRKRLKGLQIVRQSCLQSCPLGRICLALKRGEGEVHHHLGARDDLQAVARKLTSTSNRTRPQPSPTVTPGSGRPR